MRRLAAWRTPASLRERVRVVDGTAERLPLDDGWATVAWAVASYHHWSDPDAGLAELRRVLASGGRLLIVEGRARGGGWSRRHRLSREQAEGLAAQTGRAGFADASVTEAVAGRRPLLLVTARRPADPS
jgi:ubiquinone/menaquinone biosynthesis C-methylase UbiE